MLEHSRAVCNTASTGLDAQASKAVFGLPLQSSTGAEGEHPQVYVMKHV